MSEALPRPLLRPIAAVRKRLRAQRALELGGAVLGLSLLCALAAMLLARVGLLEQDASLWLALALAPLLGAALGALRPLPALLPARLLDRAEGHNDLLSSAFAFAGLPAEARTPFMSACIASATHAAERAKPAQAAPLAAPRAAPVIAGLLVALTAVALLPRPAPAPPPAAPPAPPKPRLLQREDVTLAAAEIAPLLPSLTDDPALAPLREELNDLLEALQDERLERAEALLALRELQTRLDEGELAEEREALDEALRELGERLEGRGAAQPLTDALRDADAERAREQAHRLAAELGKDARSDEALSRALKRAGARSDTTERAREELEKERERLLRRKQSEQTVTPEQRRLLDRKQRELEKLERDLARRERAERELDELRRELDDTSRSLSARDRQSAREHMERGAQQLQKLARKQLSAEQRRELAKKLEQLRELIRKQRGQREAEDGEPRAGGEGQQRLSLQRFGKLARGRTGQDGEEGQSPGEEGQGLQLVPGRGAQGQAALSMEGEGGERAGAGELSAEGRAGSRAGHGGRPEQDAEASARTGEHVDTRVQGEVGRGPTRSEVIHEAGQRGFASLPYQKVHADYARHAERVLERDHVPGGYKFYVRRYFQLIRPREDAP